MPRSELDRMRLNLLKAQMLNAYENIPFYRAAFDGAGLNPYKFKDLDELSNYPVITRAEIQTAGPDFHSKKGNLGKIRQSHSSGSTGHPLRVDFDANSWFRKKYFSKLRSRMECGVRLTGRMAIFNTAPPEELLPRNKSRLFATPLFKAKFFSVFNPEREQISDLVQWGPKVIDSSPGHLFQLARSMAQNSIIPSTVKRIFTSSEYLEPNMRHCIQDRFGAEVFDIYGCREVKEVAWECDRHDGYHINEDEVHVEILNGLSPVEPGGVGDIVLTDLRNTAMPLIRYRIGDRGMLLPGTCNCKRTFARMAPVAGRSSDFIITPSGRRLSPYLFTTTIEKVDGLLQYQFIQKDNRSITVKTVMSGHPDISKIDEIKNKINIITAEPMDIEVKICQRIEIEENGKFKVVKSSCRELQ